MSTDAHRQSVRRRWNIVMAGASHDEAVVRQHFPRLALEHDLIVRIEELEAKIARFSPPAPNTVQPLGFERRLDRMPL